MSAEAGEWRTANDPLSSTWVSAFRSSLRTFARDQLPDAMVPAHFVVLDELPKLPNGKVDRSRLPAPDGGEPTGVGYVAPSDPTQARIAQIWQDVLGVPRVGVEDSFFDLGGDSLTAVQMVARVRDEFGVALALRRLFERPTVAELAGMVAADPSTRVAGAGDSRSIGTDELAAEAVLPADIAPAADAAPPAEPPYRHVLLTGGTGFTGAFLLRELLDRSPADVHVLVRADSPAGAVDRVTANLARYRLWREGDRDRIVGVAGDLGRPYFGLSRRDYTALADTVEMVLHNGSWSSFVLPYQRLKPINVLGTHEILRLACARRVKPVHYVSSLAVFPGHRDVKHFEEVELADPDGVVGGYPQTKWVADRLVTLAGRRGLPVAVYRPGQITGSQRTGAAPIELFVCAMMKSCIQLGMSPDPDMLVEMVPVDFVAAAITRVALGGGGPERVYHLPSSQPVHWRELIDMLGDCGYPVRREPYERWYAALTAAIAEGQDNALIPFMPLLGEDGPSEDLAYQNGNPYFDASAMSAALAGSGVTCPPVSRPLLQTYLDYFVSTGDLPAPATAGERAEVTA